MKEVVIYLTALYDVAARIGAWAALLTYTRRDGSVGTKGFYQAANERLDKPLSIAAASVALRQLKEPCNVTIVTDVGYLAHSYKYLPLWRKAAKDGNWIKKDGQKVVHQWIWQRLEEAVKEGGHRVSFCYCKNQEVLKPVLDQAQKAIDEQAEKNLLAR